MRRLLRIPPLSPRDMIKYSRDMTKYFWMVAALATVSFSISSGSVLGEATDHLTVTQWVRPSEPGVFEAQVVVPRGRGTMAAVQNAQVRLAGPDGFEARGVTDENGDVKIEGVEPGVYAMTVRAEGMVGWHAMHVVDPQQTGDGVLADKAVVSPALITAQQFNEMVKPYWENEYTLDDLTLQEVDVVKLVDQIRGNERSQVSRQANGLEGNVYAATTRKGVTPSAGELSSLEVAENSSVILVRGRTEVARTVTGDSGRFFFPDLQPGVYSLVMANRDGIAAVSFELIDGADADNASLVSSDDKQFVRTGLFNSCFSCQVAPVCCGEEFVMDPLPMDPGIAGGGGAAGGGGGIGGGGLVPAALLGAAASIPGSNTTSGFETAGPATSAAPGGGN